MRKNVVSYANAIEISEGLNCMQLVRLPIMRDIRDLSRNSEYKKRMLLAISGLVPTFYTWQGMAKR